MYRPPTVERRPSGKTPVLTFGTHRQQSASKEAEELKSQRTYTIDQLKQHRHPRELASDSVFQFHAEIQLYRRYIAESRRKHVVQQQLDMPVLQHRINAILLQMNVTTYQQVFSEILSLGVESDNFVLSFVNVVFKQAVLNPPLALLYAMLSKNVRFVMQGTKYADSLNALFRERCDEAFVVPKADTDKGTLILLRGVVVFAGYLLRDGILDVQLLHVWTNMLMQSGSVHSLTLAVHMLRAIGTVAAQKHKPIIDRLAEKVKGAHDKELDELFASLVKELEGPSDETEQISRELKSPEMRKSPSVDRELGGKYGSLFKKSSSIPMELSQLAGDDEEEESLATLVNQYFYHPEFPEFMEGLERIGRKRGDGKMALDLLNVIMEQPEENIMVVWQLLAELWRSGFYGDDELKAALMKVAEESSGDERKGHKLALVYAQLVNAEIISLDDFEEVFAPLRSVWKTVVHTLFVQMDQLNGGCLDDILDNELWRNVQFLGVDTMPEKLARLQEWDLLSFLPQYDAAYAFWSSAKTGKLNTDFTTQDDIIDRHELAPIIFEVMVSFDDDLMARAASELKSWFQPCSPGIPDVASRCGEKGAALAALLK